MSAPLPDVELRARYRAILEARPELRAVYERWFDRLMAAVGDRRPVVEIGSGPGLFKRYVPHLIATDILDARGLDLACDAQELPFRDASLGAIVLVDTLHHLGRPLRFFDEVRRVLRPGGRLAMIEPWLTPFSFVLYRYFHHEECRLDVDLEKPFDQGDKRVFDGNQALPFMLIEHLRRSGVGLRLVSAQPFLALPYLLSLGFKTSRRLPGHWITFGRICERLLGRALRGVAATRIFAVYEKES